MAELIHKSLLPGPNLEVTTGHQDDGAFEVVISRPRLSDNLQKVPRAEPLCQLDWELHWDADGKVLDYEELVMKIFKGGIDHSIRSEVWKFLLDYYDFNSSAVEREAHRKAKVSDNVVTRSGDFSPKNATKFGYFPANLQKFWAIFRQIPLSKF